jgi:hypothetical protein
MTSSGAGWLCVGTQTGLNCLDENGCQVYTEETSNCPVTISTLAQFARMAA